MNRDEGVGKDIRQDESQEADADDAEDRADPVDPLLVAGALAVGRDGDDAQYKEDGGESALYVEDDPPERLGLTEEAA